jgi:hypothetical protein
VTAPPLDAVEKEEEISIADVEDILSWRQLSSSDELKRSIDNDDEVKNVASSTDSLAARRFCTGIRVPSEINRRFVRQLLNQ